MRCPSCGSELVVGARFCRACGAEIAPGGSAAGSGDSRSHDDDTVIVPTNHRPDPGAQPTSSAPRTAQPESDALRGYGATPYGDQEEPRSKSKAVLLIAALAAVAVAAVAGFWLLGRGGGGTNAGAASSTSSQPTGASSSASNGGSTTATNPSSSATTSSTSDEPTSTSQTPTAPATMPDLTGKTPDEVRQLLPGVAVTEQQQLVEDVSGGEVVAQSVKAGQPTGTAVTITVAEQAVTQYLDEVSPVSGEVSGGSVTLKGKQYPHGFSWQDDCYTDSLTVAYDLGTHYRRLRATVGQVDSSSSSTGVGQVEVFGDGKKLWTQSIEFGKPVALDLDVSGVLRLELKINPTMSPECGSSTFYAFGDPRLLGRSSEVPSPTTTSTN